MSGHDVTKSLTLRSCKIFVEIGIGMLGFEKGCHL